MTALLKNEWLKLFKRKSSWIMQIILVVIVALMAIMMFSITKITSDSSDPAAKGGGITAYTNENGQQVSEEDYYRSFDGNGKTNYHAVQLSLQDSVNTLKEQLKQAPESEKEQIQNQIDYYQGYIDAGEKPLAMNDFSNASFFGSLGSSATVATILVVIVASTIVAFEFSGGTIKLLLVRPYSRSQILVSKYLICIAYAILSSITLFLSSFIFSFILPKASLFLPLSPNTGATTAFTQALQLSGSNFILMLLFLTIAFLFSTVVRSQALAVGVGIGILFSGSILASLLPLAIAKYDWLKWLLFNLLNLNQAVMGNTVAGGLAIWQIIIGIFVYIALLLILTFTIFRKRDVALS
ncbi:ABC transporter permease [Listeria ilorinensis]|uniref:ABC transporter permease n=1 Tax=Listeria ilorinensis TaxID=2867439 RepID=UPI001EF61EDE|nr:ABC transporter permease subunit [Listeria ilorinensis]